jgi:hypothetical protein
MNEGRNINPCVLDKARRQQRDDFVCLELQPTVALRPGTEFPGLTETGHPDIRLPFPEHPSEIANHRLRQIIEFCKTYPIGTRSVSCLQKRLDVLGSARL